MLRLRRQAVVNRTKFKSLRREIKADIKKQHDLYMINLVGDVKKKKDKQGIPPLKKRGGNGVAELDSERTEELTGEFNNAFNKTEYNEVPLTRRSVPFMDSIMVSTEGVIKLLKGLNPSKTFGPDALHPGVPKELANELGPVFAYLFQ